MLALLFCLLAFHQCNSLKSLDHMKRLALGQQYLTSLKVMALNMDRGSDFLYLSESTDADSFATNVQKTFQEIIQSRPAFRTHGVVLELSRNLPDLLYLSEVSYVQNDTQTPPTKVFIDVVKDLLKNLNALGIAYDLLLLSNGEDVLSPTSLPDSGYVSFREREALLYRKDNPDLTFSNPHIGTYKSQIPATSFIPSLSFRYLSVDVTIKNETSLQFIGTYLCDTSADVQVAQGDELIELLQVTEGPVILVGSLGSDANQAIGNKHEGTHSTPTYSNLIKSGLKDVWTSIHPHPGPTWPLYSLDPFDEKRIEPYERLDFILMKQDKSIIPTTIELTGNRKCPALEFKQHLLQSDHLGIVAEFEIYTKI